MADYSAQIADIEEILRSGAKTVVIDGVTTTYDHDSLRKELSRLKRLNETTKGKRPLFATIRLDGNS